MRFLALLCVVAPIQAALTYKGVDWSSVPIVEAAGIKYKTAASVASPFETQLKASGANTVRQRLWVSSSSTYNLAYNLKLGARAKAAGLGIYLDLHFSDTWADPSHQAIPAGWPTDIENLSWELYNYTLATSNSFAAAGLAPTIISIGNEITAGMLFPTGSTSSFANLARLLHSASAGIRDSNLSPAPKILVHLDNGWNSATQSWWWTNVLAQGTFLSTDYDIQGVSYYPFYSASATLAALKTSLNALATKYKKSIVVAETDWPVTCPSPAYAFPSDTTSVGISVAGQTTWVKDVAAVVAAVTGGYGAGLFYWEPGWVGNANLGSSCADNLMVSSTGVARTSLAVFGSI